MAQFNPSTTGIKTIIRGMTTSSVFTLPRAVSMGKTLVSNLGSHGNSSIPAYTSRIELTDSSTLSISYPANGVSFEIVEYY
jgi:hypothetical protein